MKVTELAKAMNTTPDTVRYYTRIRLIIPGKNAENGYKSYDKKAQQRLKFILSVRQLGFSIKEITEILSKADKGDTPCPLVREIVERRLAETEQQFQQALALRKKLKDSIRDWESKPDKVPTGHMICHLIENDITPSNLNKGASNE